MFTEERRKIILDILEQFNRVSVNELANKFDVSKKTIRNDLNYLSSKKIISRCYGGAIYSRKKMQSEIINNFSNEIDSIFKSSDKLKFSNKKGLTMAGKVCVMGSFNVDIVAKVERFPNKGETLKSIDSILGPGGKGANQALAASKAGAQVHFVSKVGKDQFSDFAFKHLENSGIFSFTLYQSDTQSTGNALIYVSQSDGENMIAINPGANQTISNEEVSAIEEELTKSDILIVQLENNIDATVNCLKMAKKNDILTILNPAPYSKDIAQCMPYVDVITPNETEAYELSGVLITDIDSAIEASKVILNMGVNKVVITLGAKGVLVNDNGNTTHVPAYNAVCVDTTGAGDAFNGAFAAALSQNYSVINAANFAAAFASLAVELEGASAMPDKEQVSMRLTSQTPSFSPAAYSL